MEANQAKCTHATGTISCGKHAFSLRQDHVVKGQVDLLESWIKTGQSGSRVLKSSGSSTRTSFRQFTQLSLAAREAKVVLCTITIGTHTRNQFIVRGS